MSEDQAARAFVDARDSRGAVIGDHNTVNQFSTHLYGMREPVRWPLSIGNPPARADQLQPRPAESAALEQALTPSPDAASGAVLTSVLSGLGGVGKSQLAAHYYRAWIAGPGREGLALWVTATSRASIVGAYAQASAAVGRARAPPGPEGPHPHRYRRTPTRLRHGCWRGSHGPSGCGWWSSTTSPTPPRSGGCGRSVRLAPPW